MQESKEHKFKVQECKEQEINCSKDKNNTNDKQKYWGLIDAVDCVERFLCLVVDL